MTAEKKSKKGRKVMIVDDDMFLLDMYTVKFNEAKYDVNPAMGSMEALDRLRDGLEPDVILLDVVMPDMDGFELLTTIKKEKLAPKARIIILSNLGQESDVKRGNELGAEGYIVKASATPSEVVSRVEELMND